MMFVNGVQGGTEIPVRRDELPLRIVRGDGGVALLSRSAFRGFFEESAGICPSFARFNGRLRGCAVFCV